MFPSFSPCYASCNSSVFLLLHLTANSCFAYTHLWAPSIPFWRLGAPPKLPINSFQTQCSLRDKDRSFDRVVFHLRLPPDLAIKGSTSPTYTIRSKDRFNYKLQWSSIGTNLPTRILAPVHTNGDFTELILGTVDLSLTLSRIRQLNDKTLGYLKMVTYYHRCSRVLIGIGLPFQMLALSRTHRLFDSFRICSLLCFR